MVITCENIGFITRGLWPLVINPIFSLVITITTRDIFQYFSPAIYYYLILSVRFNRMKIFLVISTMMLQIIKIFYRANLIMDLTATIPPQPINSLQELANIVSICHFCFLSEFNEVVHKRLNFKYFVGYSGWQFSEQHSKND